jgi:hypothetical protein
MKYVEQDLQEMKVKGWRHETGDCGEWASVIKGAKAVRRRRAKE